MKVGDLVKPINCCSGEPGSIRCLTAIVTGFVNRGKNFESVRIHCSCGASEHYPNHLELINASR